MIQALVFPLFLKLSLSTGQVLGRTVDSSYEDEDVKFVHESTRYQHKVARIYLHPDYVDNSPDYSKRSADLAPLRLEMPVENKDWLIKLPEPVEEKQFIDT